MKADYLVLSEPKEQSSSEFPWLSLPLHILDLELKNKKLATSNLEMPKYAIKKKKLKGGGGRGGKEPQQKPTFSHQKTRKSGNLARQKTFR